ncbi:MAG: ATP-binding protein [Atopobiaceae bacterium]|nr:ATP-binding protein [Atopobiaceae bacterium]MDO4404159.1 ATP-binding protein [Atopobiaceae bacterium]
MPEQTVRLSVPAQAAFARAVRMTAASLAVACNLNVDEVEDVRMAAEEGFVLCCATEPASCDIVFVLAEGEVHTTFALGAKQIDESDDALNLAELLLSAVCDEYGVSEDGTMLRLVKRAGVANGE